MIKVLTVFPETVLAFACHGHVTKQDYASMLIPAVDPGFSGIVAGAIWDDFKGGTQHLFRRDRLAMVTDVEWMRSTFKAFSLVIPCEARVFRLEAVAKARTWIIGGVSQ